MKLSMLAAMTTSCGSEFQINYVLYEEILSFVCPESSTLHLLWKSQVLVLEPPAPSQRCYMMDVDTMTHALVGGVVLQSL